MVERRPSVLGVVTLSMVYWGALAWWQQDALFGTDSDAQMKALTMFATSFPYIGFVIWGTSNLSLIHISDPRDGLLSRMPSSA